jgi:hypothetical protein
MLRKVHSVAVLGLASSAAFVAAGCASNEKPYALTGEKSGYGVNGAGSNSTLTAEERARNTDSKGHFHPEWVGQAGR